jgi:hypothetical protein
MGLVLAILKFVAWEGALFGASIRLARLAGFKGEERWLAALAIEVTLESSVAAVFSFAGWNAAWVYWAVALGFAACGPLPFRERFRATTAIERSAFFAALLAPLIFLSFRPVEEIDSINYLHYLIDWMGNRATPYVFATNYVAFWELSFLPAWVVTGLDVFFPLLALKAVFLMALAAWLAGRELGLEGPLLGFTVFGALVMRHYWYEYSGVPTLKNDVLHGVGFVLMTLVMMRAARRALTRTDIVLLAFGVAFGSVKYTGIFFAAVAVAFVIWRGARGRLMWVVPALFLATSGHYYLHNLLKYGSPFYPFQINLGFIHLPGTADLSYSSILYNLHDPRLWRALFWPEGGLSPAGLLFPALLAGVLAAAAWRCGRAVWRRKAEPADWAALALLCGWFLYFRSVYGACAGPGDLAFILNGLNSLRYVDGVMAVSELFLAAMLGRAAWVLVGLNTASRLAMLYGKESLAVVAIAAAVGLAVVYVMRHRSVTVAAPIAALVVGGPFIVEHNRAQWTAYWNDLKPALEKVRGKDLAVLAAPDGGYFAGHAVAAGNPVDARVRALAPEEVPAARPRYLAVMITPGSEAGADWEARYGTRLSDWGYRMLTKCKAGALLERDGVPIQ